MLTRILDVLFVNQLFGANDRGETIFYPNGFMARGYLVPADSEARVRSGVRRLQIVTLTGAIVLFAFVPRLIQSWLGFTLPLGWFIGGGLVALVVVFVAIMSALSRLTAGLTPAS